MAEAVKRGEPLRRDTPKARAWARKRRKPLRPRSEKRQDQRPQEEAITAEVFRRDGGCIMRTQASHICHGPLTPHHLRKQSAGGPWTLDNVVALCAWANGEVENAPYWGRHHGLVVRHDITPADAWQRRVDTGLVVRTPQP